MSHCLELDTYVYKTPVPGLGGDNEPLHVQLSETNLQI